MDPATQQDSSSRPYDRPYDRPQYEMSGGGGYHHPDHPGAPGPWPPHSSYPGDAPAIIAHDGPEGTTFEPNEQKPYGPAPYPGQYPQHDDPNYQGHGRPDVESMPGPAGMPPHSQAGSMANYPVAQPPNMQQSQMMGPMMDAPEDLRSMRTNCQFTLREYMSLRQKQQSMGPTFDLDQQLRIQAGKAINDILMMREEIGIMIADGQGSRWRKWIIGGVIATFFPIIKKIIPAVKAIFRRSSAEKAEDKSVTDTEHAFGRSKAILSRLKDSMIGKSSMATMAGFVFGVLYIFANEVSLMVAKTVNKRLKRLSAKIEMGEQEIDEKDLKVLDGWRWRVLFWS